MGGRGGGERLNRETLHRLKQYLKSIKNVQQQQLLFVYPSVIYIYIIEYIALYFILIYYTLFLQEHFYNNNEAQICPKVKNKRRTIEARLRFKCN